MTFYIPPLVEFPNTLNIFDGSKKWYHEGKLHRENGPAVIYSNGHQEWYRKGKLHRDDGPAVIYPDGSEEWYVNGYRHRLNGPAVIMNGKEKWYQYGYLNRLDGPAVITNGEEKWYQSGFLHRLDGPAVISNGEEKWYIDGARICKETVYKNSGKDCSVCISDIDGECYKTICNHYFHIECLNEVLYSQYVCPNCRHTIKDYDDSYDDSYDDVF